MYELKTYLTLKIRVNRFLPAVILFSCSVFYTPVLKRKSIGVKYTTKKTLLRVI
jgi:hypothetical protein